MDGDCDNKSIVSSLKSVHRPYIPIIVPIGILKRDKHDNIITKTLLQDFFVISPYPQIKSGAAKMNKTVPID